ncbi:hypothetical protein GCM10023084_45550 [Streptomyces lacrimifluminis]|uniref:Uncharacterized protein n=1 Tax=Streptomyces lacrimifluminis TaxID=1500077 RepID=A0A917L638_9ACTN|nr:hypothetical protein [Streptomyces lacrimifluminis]GGJ44936.1 hypothetical protein GCM10012282_47290 [Streptomyces lacrimifluminis]
MLTLITRDALEESLPRQGGVLRRSRAEKAAEDERVRVLGALVPGEKTRGDPGGRSRHRPAAEKARRILATLLTADQRVA